MMRGEEKPQRIPLLGPPTPMPSDLADAPSILDIVRKLKDAIAEKDRIITERTRELKEARRHLENIVASIGDAVLVLDEHGTIQTVNEATLDLTGLRRDDLVGRPASDLWLDPGHQSLFSGDRFTDLLRRGVHQRTDM
ncbi:MAG: PAS domain-containing protein, partial [Planctomycetota bacterium]